MIGPPLVAQPASGGSEKRGNITTTRHRRLAGRSLVPKSRPAQSPTGESRSGDTGNHPVEDQTSPAFAVTAPTWLSKQTPGKVREKTLLELMGFA